ncbi:Ca2+ regulator and membrane fusion protein Fig1-domain-containing protein [Podospora conica]|nr:Ca2+ regulator and membrane fusion protein Fig1-domain-containing protein [Schizothecium conicum]
MSHDKASRAPDRKRKQKKGLPFLIPSCSFGYHHALIIAILVSIILLSLLLGGCSSSSALIPDIFLLSLSYQKYTPTPDPAQGDYSTYSTIGKIVSNTHLQVRVGYFGLCVDADGSGNYWLCSNNATALAQRVSVDEDPLNLIWTANQFKQSMIISYLMVVAVVLAVLCVFLLATFPAWYAEDDTECKPIPSRVVSQMALFITFLASTFVFVSVLWQYTASVAASIVARDFANGSVMSSAGTAALVLGSITCTLLMGVVGALLAMVLSKRVFESGAV